MVVPVGATVVPMTQQVNVVHRGWRLFPTEKQDVYFPSADNSDLSKVK